MAGYTSTEPCAGVLLQGTSLINCNAGIVSAAATAGQAYDSVLYGIYIEANATAVTVTIGGFKDTNGSASSMLISGSTTTDYFWMPPVPILNSFAAFTFTPSAAGKAYVFVRAYVGPERPGTFVTT